MALHDAFCSPCAATPFHFTGNLTVSDARSTSKAVFDLKASLARPITWKPHAGKLRAVDTQYVARGKGLENSATKVKAPSRMDVFKSAVNKTQKTYSRYGVVVLFCFPPLELG